LKADEELFRLAQAKRVNRYSTELHLADKLGALKQLTAMMPDWTAPQKVNVAVDPNFSGRRVSGGPFCVQNEFMKLRAEAHFVRHGG